MPARLRPRPLSALRDFLSGAAAGGYVLMAAAALALIVANSPLSAGYFAVLDAELGVSLGPLALRETVLHWINDGLMALFFLLVGLEIKREVLDGQLSRPAHLILPAAAALGGVIAPALVYLAFNSASPEQADGWAIPAATDIAFALGVLAILGSRAPTSLKIFLTAVAIIDDLAAIVIIAVFYTHELHWMALIAALAMGGVLIAFNRFKVMVLWPYLLVGLALWYFVLQSGVHATLAGVAVAMCIPLRKTPGRPDDSHSPLHRLEHAIARPVSLGVVPIFGFANAGLSFAGLSLGALLDPVPLGIAMGLFAGKQLGVFTVAFTVIKMRWADRPAYATLTQLYGVSVLCGVGFTMSLFIGGLAFSDPLLVDQMKIGVLLGSGLSAVLGLSVLALAASKRPTTLAVLAAPERPAALLQDKRGDETE